MAVSFISPEPLWPFHPCFHFSFYRVDWVFQTTVSWLIFWMTPGQVYRPKFPEWLSWVKSSCGSVFNTVSCFKCESSVGWRGGEVWGLKECSFITEKLVQGDQTLWSAPDTALWVSWSHASKWHKESGCLLMMHEEWVYPAKNGRFSWTLHQMENNAMPKYNMIQNQ